MTSQTSTYAPAVLLIEDDRPAREYYRDKFHDETSLGVVVAKDLREARRLIDTPGLHIDAIVADLFFDFDKDDPESGLLDGIDILQYGQNQRPTAFQYVNSFWADRHQYGEKARKLKLPIKVWFSKQFMLPGDLQAPWAQVERDLIQARLVQDPALREKAGVPADLDIVTEAIRKSICPTRRTYLQELTDPMYHVLQPIEVLDWQDYDGQHHAAASRLGLLTDGLGDSSTEAIAALCQLIVDHKMSLDDIEPRGDDYASFVRGRLKEYVGKEDE